MEYINMEMQKCGNVEMYMEIWKFGNMKIQKFENLKNWKFGNMDIQIYGYMEK